MGNIFGRDLSGIYGRDLGTKIYGRDLGLYGKDPEDRNLLQTGKHPIRDRLKARGLGGLFGGDGQPVKQFRAFNVGKLSPGSLIGDDGINMREQSALVHKPTVARDINVVVGPVDTMKRVKDRLVGMLK